MIQRSELEKTLWSEREKTLELHSTGVFNVDLTIGRIGGLQRIAMVYGFEAFTETTAVDFYLLRNSKAPRCNGESS